MIHIVLICIAYVVGIIGGLYLSLDLGIAFLCLNISIIFIVKKYINLGKNIILSMLIILAFGFLYSNLKLEYFQNKYDEAEVEIIIKIVDFKKQTEYSTQYLCKNEVGEKFLIYLPNEINADLGDVFYVKANFEKPAIKRNRGGFDYSKYIYSQNIYGMLKVRDVNNIYKKEIAQNNIIYEIRKNIKGTFEKILPQDEFGIMTGILIGDTSYITKKTEESFKSSGITHLLAVSGSNIAYVILFTKFIFNKILGKRYSNYIVIIFVIVFMIVSGCTPSVVRATIMGCIIIIAEILSRKPNIYASISISAIIILTYNPLISFDVGFILSFGGTLGIVFLYERIKQGVINFYSIENTVLLYIVETLSLTLAAQIILLPIMCYNFNSISSVAIIVNILVVPISGLVTILGFIIYISSLFCFPAAKFLGYSIYILIRIVINIANFFSSLPFATVLVITPSIIWIIIYYIILVKIYFKIKNKNFNILISVLVITSLIYYYFPSNYLEINFVDVGQGDCTYIETKNGKNILIDGGGSEGSDYNVGEQILLPYILDRQKTKIDLIVVSHMHEDHIEGLFTIIDNLKVSRIVIGPTNIQNDIYTELIKKAYSKRIIIDTVYEGDVIFVDDVKIEVLYPKRGNEISNNENNNSLVLKLACDGVSVLFTGDAEKEVEDQLKNNISSDILKVSHHGSNTSSTERFINIVNPKISLIGVGKNNTFGHPNNEIVKRLYQKGSLVYRTDIYGEIMIKIQNRKIKVDTLIKDK